jgi:hypothetical protein
MSVTSVHTDGDSVPVDANVAPAAEPIVKETPAV